MAIALLAACGDEPNNEHELKLLPTSPTGSIVGSVVNGSRLPLEGATVSASYGDKVRKANVGADGSFSFTNVPAGGDVGLKVEAEGHAPALLTALIPNAAGEAPMGGASVQVGPILLIPLTGSLTFELVGEDGTKLSGVGAYCKASASWANLAGGDETPMGALIVEAEVAKGNLTCAGLPSIMDLARLGGWIELLVPAVDVDGDGIAEYRGGTDILSAQELLLLGQETFVATLFRNAEGLSLRATNAPGLMGRPAYETSVPGNTGVEFVFSHPVVVHFSSIRDDSLTEQVGHNVVVDGNQVALRPKGGAWSKGQIFHMEIMVAPASAPMDILVLDGSFLTASDKVPTFASATFLDGNANETLDFNERVTFTMTEVVGHPTTVPFSLLFVPVQVNHDLDGSGTIGDAAGELGNDDGFQARLESHVYGFSRRATLDWPLFDSVPKDAEMVLRFDLSERPFFNASGKLITEKMSKKLVAAE